MSLLHVHDASLAPSQAREKTLGLDADNVIDIRDKLAPTPEERGHELCKLMQKFADAPRKIREMEKEIGEAQTRWKELDKEVEDVESGAVGPKGRKRRVENENGRKTLILEAEEQNIDGARKLPVPECRWNVLTPAEREAELGVFEKIKADNIAMLETVPRRFKDMQVAEGLLKRWQDNVMAQAGEKERLYKLEEDTSSVLEKLQEEEAEIYRGFLEQEIT